MLSIGVALALFLMICSVGAIGTMVAIMLVFTFSDRLTGWVRHRTNQYAAARVLVSSAYDRYQIRTLCSVAQCLAAPACVTAVFVGLSGSANREWEHFQTAIRQQNSPVLVEAQKPRSVPVDPLTIQDQNLALNRPKWITDGERPLGDVQKRPLFKSTRTSAPSSDGESTLGDVRKVVLSSHLWSTEAEAKSELQTKVAEIVRADFEQRHHGWFDPTGYRFLSSDRMAEVAVKERYVERIEQDFGKFSAPMNRIWWQVEISPMVRTELYPAWKSAESQNRIVVVGILLALITLIGSSFGLHGKLKRFSNYTTIQAASLTSLCFAFWMLVEVYVARRLLA